MKIKILLALFSLGLIAVSSLEARRHWWGRGYYPYSYYGYGCNSCAYPSWSNCCYYY